MAADKTTIDTEIVGASNEYGVCRSFPQMRNLNPHTLLSSDILGALLTYIKLKADNYDRWSLSFPGSLGIKWKDCLIDDTAIIWNCDSQEYADGAPMNTLIVSWIFTTLDSFLIPYIPYKVNAQGIMGHAQETLFC